MIVASLLLVIAAAVTLIVGLLNREVISWVYASIACCLAAGLLLTVGVLRSRPSRKPVLQSGGEGQSASWAGASQWGSSGSESGAAVLTRDEDEDQPAVRVTSAGADESELAEPSAPQASEEPTQIDMPAESASPWAPADANGDDTGEMPDVRLIPPPQPVDPAGQPVAADPDDDLEIVPKPSARSEAADDGWSTDESASAIPPPPPAAAPGAATGASAAVDDDAARFEQVLSPIAGVGPGKRAALLAHFGTYRKLRAATPEKLAQVQGISKTLAQRIYDTLHSR